MFLRIQGTTTPGWRALLPRLMLGLLLLTSLAASASTTLNVVQNGELVRYAAIPGVAVMRQGARLVAGNNMQLQAGDEIRTDAQSTAVLSFASGARVYVQPNAHVRLGSIFVVIGEILVKVKGYFQVQTEYATAASEGTEYLVRVERDAHVRVVVAEDLVGLTSNGRRWEKTPLEVGQAAWIVGPDFPETGPANPGEIEGIRKRISNLDSLMPGSPDLGSAAILMGIIGIGAGIISSRSHDDDNRQPPASRSPSQTPAQIPSRVPSQAPAQVPAQSTSQMPSRTPSRIPSQWPAQTPSRFPSRIP